VYAYINAVFAGSCEHDNEPSVSITGII